MTGVAALLAGLGVVAIGFGILSALMALLQPYTDPLWIFGNIVIGVALLGSAVVMSFESLRERLRSGGVRRAGKYGTSAIAMTSCRRGWSIGNGWSPHAPVCANSKGVALRRSIGRRCRAGKRTRISPRRTATRAGSSWPASSRPVAGVSVTRKTTSRQTLPTPTSER